MSTRGIGLVIIHFLHIPHAANVCIGMNSGVTQTKLRMRVQIIRDLYLSHLRSVSGRNPIQSKRSTKKVFSCIPPNPVAGEALSGHLQVRTRPRDVIASISVIICFKCKQGGRKEVGAGFTH